MFSLPHFLEILVTKYGCHERRSRSLEFRLKRSPLYRVIFLCIKWTLKIICNDVAATCILDSFVCFPHFCTSLGKIVYNINNRFELIPFALKIIFASYKIKVLQVYVTLG